MAEFLLVIRSGKTAYDLEGRIKGTLDIPLSDEGIAESHALAARAVTLLDNRAGTATDRVEADGRALRRMPVEPLRRLFTSASCCARETAAIVGRRLGMTPQVWPGLENLDQGLWQGMRVEEIEERQPRLYRQWRENPWSVAPPEGELLDECRDRVAAVIEALTRRYDRGGFAVVAPEPLARVIRWLVGAEPLGDLWQPLEEDDGIQLLPLSSQWAAVDPGRDGSLPDLRESPRTPSRRRLPFFSG